MDELVKLDNGDYPPWFVGKLLAWDKARMLVHNHSEDAKIKHMEKTKK